MIRSFRCAHTQSLYETGKSKRFSGIINDQWRLCFRWTAAGPEDVEIVDYH